MTATETKPHALTPEQVANVEKWIAALRSGEYRQGHFKLHQGERYCCLGVACAVADIEHDYGDGAIPDEPARSVLGLVDGGGNFDSQTLGGVASLWRLNDMEEKTFPQIADFIEEQLRTNSRKLFVTD